MVLIHVSAQAKGNVGNEFERTLCEVVEDARKTTGCMRYEWYRAPDVPQRYIMETIKKWGQIYAGNQGT